MLNRVSSRPVFVLGIVLLGLASGCAGEDLSRSNYQRTTVTAEAGSGQGGVPAGPITDPAFGLSALRSVDPCELLSGDDVIGDLGTVSDEPYESEWGSCRVDVQDAGGKTVEVGVDLGASPMGVDPTGAIEGLPFLENKLDDVTCYSTAIYSEQPALGVTVQTGYQGGNPCDVGYTTLQKVVRALRAEPAKYDVPAGSLLEADPCASADEAVLAQVLGGSPKRMAMGLHKCDLSFGAEPTISVRFRAGYPPDTTDGGTEVDLGGGVKAIQEPGSTDTAECSVEWVHRPGEDGANELATVDYYDYNDGASKDDACSRALEVAKSVAPKLPTA
ncbi:hypothetical protein [Prauserella endophytica]|uniref:DUF3558 domain-containing protein n=1 Tax=Prauserella endophytica TaxID=1592324 RepID=A0ABY2RZ21_9PSEU|nr:hypothetical protein [Prauserella endophytica]TKG66200.1 hypothetical protein FCN18_25510 [Prauserella endophytica]